MRIERVTYLLILVIGFIGSIGTDGVAAVRWDMDMLSVTPKVWPDPNRSGDGVQAVFYEGLPWKDKPTRVFAYYGVPEVEPGQTVPAMVLVHGGGGTAFDSWVKIWLQRGYAAIAMDTCGSFNTPGEKGHPRHEHGGPAGWGGFDQLDWPAEDQWTYHAVADVILAHSLIRSLPGVDGERTGLTGVSWGGYLTCIVSGVDSRFKFAAPIYGCGFLGDNSVWLDTFEKLGADKTALWLSQWDPSQYLSQAKMPMLWVTGTNDFAYPMDSLQKSYHLPKSPRTLCLRVRMPHGHGGLAFNAPEVHTMAKAVFEGKKPLPKIVSSGRQGRDVWATFESPTPIVKAELNYTTDTGKWQDRKWETIEATVDVVSHKVSTTLPEGVTVYYLNLIDERNLIVSSEHEEM